MIEQFAIPGWVHLLLRLTGRHFRHSTGWSRRRKAVEASGVSEAIIKKAAAAIEVIQTPLPPVDAFSTGAKVTYVTADVNSDIPGAAMAAVSKAVYSEGRLTQSFLDAARAMEQRTRSLVAATIVEPVRSFSSAVAAIESTSFSESASSSAPTDTMADALPASPPFPSTAAQEDADTQPHGSMVLEISQQATPPALDIAPVSVGGQSPAATPPMAEKPEPAAAPAPAPAVSSAAATAMKSAASTVLAPAIQDEYNRTGLDFRRPMPRPKVRGRVIDFHCHLLARRHAEDWFETADHYGIDAFVTMSPLEEAVALARDWGHRVRFIAVPQWGDTSPQWVDHWLTRIEAFHNLGSRIAKFHASPGTMLMRGHRLGDPIYRPLFSEVKSRGMAIMTHLGDPDTWYLGKYADTAKFGSRDEHYQMWEELLEEHRGTPWVGAHMGGNPEDLARLQRLLDRFPDLLLDCSATRWMVREISARREPAREFFIRNQDRILFGSDQVSGDDRHFDFLASRFWCHRKLWETAYIGPSPIIDPDLPKDEQPTMRGLALPDGVLQKLYHDNPTKLLERIGMSVDPVEAAV